MRDEVTFFNDQSVNYRKEYDRETTDGYSFRVRRQKVLDLMPENGHGKTVLDVAAGPGIMVPGLLARGYHVTITDAAPEMVERAKEEYGKESNVTFTVADVYHLPFKDASFDVISAMGLLEYLADEQTAYKEMVRVLKPGGLLIITYPHQWSPWRMIGRVVMWISSIPRALYKKIKGTRGHYVTHREYTPAEVHATFREHGITPDRTLFYNFKLIPWPFDQWLPRFTVSQSKVFERLDGTLFRFIGTGFIVRGKKKELV